jgi:DNA-binding transcriptional regulator YdaS (Cro superfamily)
MEKLIQFFGDRKRAAEAIGVTPNYLSMINRGKRQFSPSMAIAIDRLTQGAVSKQYLRPDIFESEAS